MCDTTHTDQGLRPSSAGATAPIGDWLIMLRRYLVAIVVGNLAWEFAQLPLYTIWHEGSMGEIVFAALHCTSGDLVIASLTLLGALAIAADSRWPHARFTIVAALAVFSGLAYTVFSEWLNTEIRGSWAYTDWMPTLPVIGSGVAPLAQWLLIPPFALWWARHGIRQAPRLDDEKAVV